MCISRALATKMMPYAGNGKLIQTAEYIRLPDDCTIGYIINALLGYNLTVNTRLHSHLEALSVIQKKDVVEQLTLSYALVWLGGSSQRTNLVNVQGLSLEEDPTRFLSIHCTLVPRASFCPTV